MFMRPLLVSFAAALFISGCDEGSPTTPASDQARISLVVSTSDVAAPVGATGVTGVVVAFRVSESGGVGVRMDFVRLDVVDEMGQAQATAESGADVISAGPAGDNRIDANATESVPVGFLFGEPVAAGAHGRVTARFTDDNGTRSSIETHFTIGQ
jgi:hypothetical protein